MSLQDEMKRLREELAATEEPEVEIAEESEAVEEPEAEPEEPKPEPAKEPEAPTDDSGWAKMRRELKAAEKRAEEAERRERESKSVEVEAPVAAEVPIEIQISRAETGFKIMEEKFRKENPQANAVYDDVAQQYFIEQARSLKIQNPRLTDTELLAKTKQFVLNRADSLYQQGYNPAEEMFHEAMELGIKPRAKEAAKEEVEAKEIKPDLKKVAENRKRSTGMAAATGHSEGEVTLQHAATLSTAEWAKLPPATKRRLMYGS